MLHNAAQTYQTNQVTTAAPSELTLMLYNGAIKFIKQAKVALEERNFVKVHENCLKVQNILFELMSSLKKDFPVSRDFEKMYEYMLRRTVEANMRKNMEILDEVEDLFIQFRDTWKEAMILARSQG
ncbi:flagellar export chaperone FliS [Brevibacillus sp. 179-C9.3 HS]|uniref:flagellar export chaperone FliS n=1 Tax=unclassified Brevibacillus TaxID=2684853 RepID=UPI0039A3BBF9